MYSRVAALVGAMTLVFGGASSAADAPRVSVELNASVANDYIFRGISQTNGQMQVAGGADATLGGTYAGVWASNVDFGNGTDAEYDLYAGARPELGPLKLDLGVIRYGYVDAPPGPKQDFWEVKAGFAAPLGKATLGASIFYSPEFFRATGDATYVELKALTPIAQTPLSLSGAVGRQWVERGVDYTTWNLGVTAALTERLAVDVRYSGTSDQHALGTAAGDRLTAALKATF